MIRLEQLHSFVGEISNAIIEEEQEKYRWEFFLHKVYDKTYEEYLRLVRNNTNKSNQMQEDEIKNIVYESQALLSLF